MIKEKELQAAEEEIRKNQVILTTAQKELQEAREKRLIKEEELLKQQAAILEEQRSTQKMQIDLMRKEQELQFKIADLMRKEHDLEIKEKAINLASLKLGEKINSQKVAAERDLVNDFFVVDYYGSGENALPTRDTNKGGKSNSKRFRPSIDQLEADAKLLGSMCRTQSRDLRDLHEDSNERSIE